MSEINKQRKIAIVLWEDVVATDSNWRTEDEGIEWLDDEKGIVSQVGYLLERDTEYVVLIDSFFACGDTIGAVTRIPASLVRSIKIIEPSDQ